MQGSSSGQSEKEICVILVKKNVGIVPNAIDAFISVKTTVSNHATTYPRKGVQILVMDGNQKRGLMQNDIMG
jgi:hypothetical protein